MSRRKRQTAAELVAEHADLPKKLALRYGLQRYLPALLDIDDLTQIGTMAMMEAAERFEPSRDIKFQTYASRRVIGAMLDEIRGMRFGGRLHHDEVRVVSIDATSECNIEHARNADDRTLSETLADERQDVFGDVCVSERVEAVRALLMRLSPLRRIIARGLLAGRNQRWMAVEGHVTESRISQLLPRVRDELALMLSKHGRDIGAVNWEPKALVIPRPEPPAVDGKKKLPYVRKHDVVLASKLSHGTPSPRRKCFVVTCTNCGRSFRAAFRDLRSCSQRCKQERRVTLSRGIYARRLAKKAAIA